ncbi:hypothetical protein OC834_001100 [Tilletia horrida]|nr:hypothetical protein OC834_001100 [Tilletia horrida]
MSSASPPSSSRLSIGYSTSSLGPPPASATQPPPPLPTKLAAIASAGGFSSIELAFSDLRAYASLLERREVGEEEWAALERAAGQTRALCEQLGLRIVVLQPFPHFEGWPRGSEEHARAWERMRGWTRIALAAGTHMIQVGSTDIPLAPRRLESASAVAPSPSASASTLRESVVQDLRELGQYCAKLSPSPLRIAYEPWCWSTHAPTWADCHAIIRAVDMPGVVGLCLDTFQIAGGELADPTTASGFIESGDEGQGQGQGGGDVHERFRASLERLSKEVRPEDIFFLQISDAYKPLRPYYRGAPDGRKGDGPKTRAEWSDTHRPAPFTTSTAPGASAGQAESSYLTKPITDVFRAVLRTGWRGDCTIEVFDDPPHHGYPSQHNDEEQGGKQAGKQDQAQRCTAGGLLDEARRALAGWERLCKEAAV